jgi:hypothetical protein
MRLRNALGRAGRRRSPDARYLQGSRTCDGTEHRTASFGVGIEDAATHGWQTGSCSSHHIICSVEFASSERFEKLKESATRGDVDAIRTMVADVDGSDLTFDEVAGEVTVLDCAGRTAAVVFVAAQ